MKILIYHNCNSASLKMMTAQHFMTNHMWSIATKSVFKWPDGRPYSPDYVSHRFRELLKKHNLPHIRFHELRHSCASILITMGFSLKDIQEWLGHSDIKMTANIYAHLDVARKNKVAESLSLRLNDKGGRKMVDEERITA